MRFKYVDRKQNSVNPRHNEMLNEVRSHLERSAYKSAHELCILVLSEDSKNPRAYYFLGALTADHKNYNKAIQLYKKAIELGLEYGEAEAQIAKCFLVLSEKVHASSYADLASEKVEDSDAFTLDTIGVVLSRVGRHRDAVPFYQKATLAAPDKASYHYNLGVALQFDGQFEGAEASFCDCLRLDPSDTRARIALVSLEKQTKDNNSLMELKSAWESFVNKHDVNQHADEALQLCHAIAKSYEDLGEPITAMEWLQKGKSIKVINVYDRQKDDVKVFEVAAKVANSIEIDDNVVESGPVFIVGMPRTGTTLLDRIISSHSKVSSAGELSDFSIALKQHSGTEGSYVLDGETLLSATNGNLDKVGEDYLNRVRSSLNIDGVFTDKMPLNFFFAPSILAAIPNARVICLRRHPADTMLSNYRQLFATSFSYYAYAYDLKKTASYVVEFNKLVSRYELDLPTSRFKIVDYEDLIFDIEAQVKSIVEFAGLHWENACLDFQNNSSPVATASSTQVRQPLYTTSINRWKKYRPSIDAGLEILNKAGLMPCKN